MKIHSNFASKFVIFHENADKRYVEHSGMYSFSLNISCAFHYVPHTAYPRIGIFSGENLRVLFIKSKRKNDNNCILHMRIHARTCAMSINAEIKKFVKQLRKTNTQHKT